MQLARDLAIAGFRKGLVGSAMPGTTEPFQQRRQRQDQTASNGHNHSRRIVTQNASSHLHLDETDRGYPLKTLATLFEEGKSDWFFRCDCPSVTLAITHDTRGRDIFDLSGE